MAISISAVRLIAPVVPTGPGRAEVDVAGVSGQVGIAFYAPGPTGPPLYSFTGTAPGTVNCPGVASGSYFISAGFAGPPSSVATATYSVPAYAPPAAPTVQQAPPALAAAHLPVLLALLAAPFGDPPQAAALVVAVEVYRAGLWQLAGVLREVCDATGRAEFYLNEYLKTQFDPTPPDESGTPDPALAIRYRARYGRAPFDGTTGEAGTVQGLALNAALPVNPTAAALPLGLGPPMPYAAVPASSARFQSIVLADASGVANVPTVAVNSSAYPCPVRQFVWLHPSGAWCWGLFAGRHEHGAETGEDVTVRRPDGDYYVGGGDTRATLRVYSDKLDWPTFQVLRTIRTARRVYERLPSGQYLPVLLERGAFADYKETDKLFEVNFLARYPVQTVQTF